MDSNLPRLRQLQSFLKSTQAFLLSTPTDITYFTGFEFLVAEEREAFLCITKKAVYLIKAHFSPFPTHSSIHVQNNCTPQGLAGHLEEIISQHHISELYIDESSMFVHEYRAVQAIVKKTKLTLKELEKKEIWKMRMVKSQEELTLVRRACQITGEVWQNIQPLIQEGVTEKKLANMIEVMAKELGAEDLAFPTIVAFGPGSSEPHYQPQEIKLQQNMPVLIDFGVKYHGYRSDTTRTFWFGDTPSREFEKVETAIHAAYTAAKMMLEHPGHTAKEIDAAARNALTDAGYGKYFIHTTGHGVGLDIHEPPSLHWGNDQEILPHMVITIEPGVYLADQFGYRHENTVLITSHGPEELTLLP